MVKSPRMAWMDRAKGGFSDVYGIFLRDSRGHGEWRVAQCGEMEIKIQSGPWPGSADVWTIAPYTKTLPVRFLVRAHSWVVGLIAGHGV